MRRPDLELVEHSWGLLGGLMKGHVVVYRVSHGLVGHHVPGAPPMLLLDHVGARSGKRRTTPLVYMPDGDDLLVVASKGGYPKDPGWMHNLRAHPDTEVQIGHTRLPVRAREAGADERRRLWPKAAKYNPHWARYRQRTSREIPLVLLEPR